MKNVLTTKAASLTLVLLLTACLAGCQTSGPRTPSPAGTELRNNCYGLLHQLLNDEKDVSLLRFIKSEHSDVKDLTRRIAAAAGTDAKRLEEFARQDPSLDLKDIGLPPGEAATREAIASAKEKELLGHSGGDFELALLMSQAEALNYGWHLAKVAGEHETRPDRAAALAGISEEMKQFYNEVFRLLRAKGK